MTIQEVFNSPAVKAVEIEILDVIMEEENTWKNPQGKVAVRHLLSLRRQILNKMFVLTDEYKKLLSEFNNKLMDALLNMRWQTKNMHDAALDADQYGVETIGKVFMSYKYPENHPIQTERAKKIWNVLNNSLDTYIPLYEDGVDKLHLTEEGETPSENSVLYLSEDIGNWNEGLDRDKTSDMHLCHGVHNLIDHMDFSIFDILRVRDFSIEITCQSTHCTGSEEWDDIDWDKCDYYD